MKYYELTVCHSNNDYDPDGYWLVYTTQTPTIKYSYIGDEDDIVASNKEITQEKYKSFNGDQ